MTNDSHSNLKFTVEKSKNGIAFLDTFINIDTENKCHTSVFRKNTFTGLILNFKSLCPVAFKVSILLGYLHRAFCICSSNFYHLVFFEKISEF